MKTLLRVVVLVPSIVLAKESVDAAKSDDPMAGWVPPKVKNEAKDKQEIQALYRAMDAAGRTGDLDAAAALVDFPVMMMTDDSKGQGMGGAWSREQWLEVMRPFYEKPMKDAKITHKPTIFLLTDSLASVDDVVTVTQGGKTITARNSTLLIRRDGTWRVKAMAEGGWGDMMAQQPPSASGADPTAPGSTGSGGQAHPSPAPGATQPQPTERTTK